MEKDNLYHVNSKHVAKVLKTLRKRNHFSQKLVGKKLNKSHSFISRVENNKRKLNDKEIEKYLEILEIKKERYFSLLETLLFFEKVKTDFDNEELENQNENQNKIQDKTQSKTKIERTVLLQQLKTYFETKPIKTAYLFGSVARDEHSFDSDIDLYLEFLEDYKLNLFYLSKMKNEIVALIGKEVDLVLKGTEHKFIKENLEREKILISQIY